MTLSDIQNRVKYGEEYRKMRDNPHIKDRLMFLVLGGSWSYGTNNEDSDIDIRGCALNSPSDILGLSSFEQFLDNQTDTMIYSFNKLISLLLQCNPNTIEMLGCKKEHYFFVSSLGLEFILNTKLFLSKRCINSFGGYARQQLRRLENALARDRLSQARKEEHILHAMESGVQTFKDRYSDFGNGSIKLYTDISQREELDREIFMDANLIHYPAREFNSIMNDLKNVLDTYDNLNNRNKKKDDKALNKHAMHLVRLYLSCFDILERQEIITYREKDHDFLMSIRNGEYMNEDGTYRNEFFDMINDFDKRLKYDAENTSLSDHPDMKKVEEFVMYVNRKSLE